jgi:hypothetical protein
MKIPARYEREFRRQTGRVGICKGDSRPEMWICRRCGLHILPNTLGAQSHIAKHVRQAVDRLCAWKG